jgi:hypothetical protein
MAALISAIQSPALFFQVLHCSFQKLHYQRLKQGVAIYLCRVRRQLPPFPSSSLPFQLRGFVDASHASHLHNHSSTTRYGFLLANVVSLLTVVICNQSPLLVLYIQIRRLNFLMLMSKLPRRLPRIFVLFFLNFWVSSRWSYSITL